MSQPPKKKKRNGFEKKQQQCREMQQKRREAESTPEREYRLRENIEDDNLYFAMEQDSVLRNLIGHAVGENVFIPRIPIIPSDFQFQFKCLQFPVRLSFPMSSNKAPGQSLKAVGLDLLKLCFSHGQLYASFSRVGKTDNLYILTPSGRTAKIIHPEALRKKEEGLSRHAMSCHVEVGLILKINFCSFMFLDYENRHNNKHVTGNVVRVLLVFKYTSSHYE